jgi:hypothetical protein
MSRDPFSFDPREEQEADVRPVNGASGARAPKRSHEVESPAIDATSARGSGRLPATHRRPEALDSPRAHHLGDRTYFVRDSELQTLAEVGTFRAVAAADLARLGYGGDTQRMEREIRRLKDQYLVSEKTIAAGRSKTIRLFTLTKKGARLARTSGIVPEEQALYHGFVKPREAKHDADLYRLYYAQAERIQQSGGSPTHVLLDFELKRNLNRDMAAIPAEELTDDVRERIARRHGLAVVDGKIPVPDLRVEYDTAEMEHKHLDLELATRNYRPRALGEKAKAGFSLYALREDASRIRRVLDQREITAEIFSL